MSLFSLNADADTRKETVMSAAASQPYAAFRLNLEQQKKRAKDLLKAAQSGEPAALRRLGLTGTPDKLQLANAQHCIARELRFANWAALKLHIGAMVQTRAALEGASCDSDRPTMHIRCGDDIRQALLEAGFTGAFNRHINPYLQGPVTDAPDWLEQRARFIMESIGNLDSSLTHDAVLQGLLEEESQLARASRDYERVVLWLEHDRYDQFVLLRCLSWFAEHGAPPDLQLVGPNDYPGATRFLGLGQLPPEALRLLWEQRRSLSKEQVAFGRTVWKAFRSSEPRPLADWVRTGTPLFPDLAAALRRHLQELPSVDHVLGMTQWLLLSVLAEQSPVSAGRLVGTVMQRDPLPGLGDIGYEYELRQLAKISDAVLLRNERRTEPGVWRHDALTITARGRAALAGTVHLGLSELPERWVGGVRIAAGQNNWRWDDKTLSVISG
jgi:hypothetical protein